jgi:hypothetical protein
MKYNNSGQKTLVGIMAVVLLFLIADIIVFALMFFNVQLDGKSVNNTDNTIFNHLSDNTTDNTVLKKISPTVQIKTDNSK